MTDPKTQLAKAPPNWLAGFLKNNERRISSLLQSKLEPRYFLSLWMSAAQSQPKLLACTQPSLMGAVLALAELGLEPNSPRQEVALVPYKYKGEMICQVIIMRNGYVRLALRSGQIRSVKGVAVRERDDFLWDEASDLGLVRHVPFGTRSGDGGGDPGDLLCAYGIGNFTAGGRVGMVIPGYEILATKARALTRLQDWQIENSPWTTHENAMWAKTACKRLCAVLLQHFEAPGLRKALDLDERAATISGESGEMEGVVLDIDSQDVTKEEAPSEAPPKAVPKDVTEPKVPDPERPMTPEELALADYRLALDQAGLRPQDAFTLNRELHGTPNPTKLSADQLRASAERLRRDSAERKAGGKAVLDEVRAAHERTPGEEG